MVDLSAFLQSKPQPAKETKTSNPKIEIKPLTQKIEEITKREGMRDDEPLKEVFIEFGKVGDELRHLAKSFGPDAGRIAADAAATIMRQEAGRLSNRISGLTLAVHGLGMAAMLGGGVWIGWSLRGAEPVQVAHADIPRAMAERFPSQNWQAQWDKRQILPLDKNGLQWSLVPFVERLPNPPVR